MKLWNRKLNINEMNTIWIDETTGENYTQLLSYYFMPSGLPYPAPKVICVFVS